MKKILLMATSLFVLSANAANACSCAPATPQQSFERSSAVFSGRVIDVIEGRERGDSPSTYLAQKKVVFEVSNVWKGQNKQRLVVVTSGSSASCGYGFEEGKEYLVYASNQDAKLETGLCSGTKLFSEARADLAVLGKGEKPTTENANAALLQLLQNQRKWRSNPNISYRYRLRVGCFCPRELTQPVDIEVRNGRVTSIVAANGGKSVNQEFFQEYNSIPKLFNIVRDAIAKDAHRLEVTYHPTLGYPTQISIDYNAQIADEERYLTVENLQVIGSR